MPLGELKLTLAKQPFIFRGLRPLWNLIGPMWRYSSELHADWLQADRLELNGCGHVGDLSTNTNQILI